MLACLMVWRFSLISPFGARMVCAHFFVGLHFVLIGMFLTYFFRFLLAVWMLWRCSLLSPFCARLVWTYFLVGWHLIWMARFLTNSLPCSMPSSRKKQ